ncbi:hypothetical protein LRP67_19630 [Nocardioides sp. cx-169]|uniref:hypothetical protein n=1 Tax=Nocardioides sp. cx-169 TaxID=2899080 RepID=UPI001E454676|nr:hypothetical protein [Nocardioides sp. cx-169]MCD4536309.1 hypothetical protein [Nocardioides sp. cx-169]
MLLDALQTVVAAAHAAGGRLVVVDAVHERALSFYERYGFIRIGRTLRLYLKVTRIESSLKAAGLTSCLLSGAVADHRPPVRRPRYIVVPLSPVGLPAGPA